MKIYLPPVMPIRRRITFEWAKQLLYLVREASGEDVDGIDFAGLQLIQLTDKQASIQILKVPIAPPMSDLLKVEFPLDLWKQKAPFEYEDIKIQFYGDPVNNEKTRMGYGPQTNILVLGWTYIWKPEAGSRGTPPGNGR
jgi:hypothetical protein